METARKPKAKMLVLAAIVALYATIGVVFGVLVSKDIIKRTPPPAEQEQELQGDTFLSLTKERLEAAKSFMRLGMIEENGHVNLYVAGPAEEISIKAADVDHDTNSEALSYYLLWTARAGEREGFEQARTYIEEHMTHPQAGYLMWRLNEQDEVEEDGANIASDADLRAIKALAEAQKQWPQHQETYDEMIGRLATGLERVAVTEDGYLAPYGGASGEASSWTSDEVWLSYTDFNALQELAERRGEPWLTVKENMKQAVLGAQIHNGLYNSMLTNKREYGNGIDGSGYSINSLWIMVRSAESDDEELRASARESLSFYEQKYEQDGKIYQKYASDGNPVIRDDAPWVYALVGRAAISLGEEAFAENMLEELYRFQEDDITSPYYGAIPEGREGEDVVGQFTMQESIITMQAYVTAQGGRG